MRAGTLVEELSARLPAAGRDRTPIVPITDSHPDLTEADAYRIQDALVAARGDAVVGYKLGFTSRAMRDQMGVPGPNYRRLTRGMSVVSGTVPLSALIHPRVEPEVALLVERDLRGPDVRPERVFGALPDGGCGAVGCEVDQR